MVARPLPVLSDGSQGGVEVEVLASTRPPPPQQRTGRGVRRLILAPCWHKVRSSSQVQDEDKEEDLERRRNKGREELSKVVALAAAASHRPKVVHGVLE